MSVYTTRNFFSYLYVATEVKDDLTLHHRSHVVNRSGFFESTLICYHDLRDGLKTSRNMALRFNLNFSTSQECEYRRQNNSV